METPRRIAIQRHEQNGAKICGGQDAHIGVALNLSTGHSVRRRVGNAFEETRPRFGMMNLLPPGALSEIDVQGRSRVILVAMPWAEFAAAVNDHHDADPGKVELLIRHHGEDAELTRLILTAACRGPAAATAAIPLIAGHLLARHSNRPGVAAPARAGGLSPAKLRKLLDRIEAEIDAPLLLHELAAAANLSVFHFAREFAKTVGIPPHSYILKRRVHRALETIANETGTTLEAAVAAGFVDTSHFARHFRNQYGFSLREYRKGALTPRGSRGPAS